MSTLPQCEGSAVPGVRVSAETRPELRAELFSERRELGVFNVGGAGSVVVVAKRRPIWPSGLSDAGGSRRSLCRSKNAKRSSLLLSASAIRLAKNIQQRMVTFPI